ncbi:centrosomal protein of 72 kDa [Orycteropus afer afer]|uniref:Centrosomal protein of 72 kDa n=1 Tax=Orycteropus afer afer TaxID=1230840 RepID=A0A8B7B1E6_ORYAF|nr:centrosomal protein of 72 kDa [Orycteropus afer afer]
MALAGVRLVLCEKRIREKSGLTAHHDLGELQSLSIPGTYQEKITHLGNSLMSLTSLKSLDLSRNSLVSLEGIQYLTRLERLNLYYNCISSLAEVFRLHSLLELMDVDFRLNPVVKNESDYRLFVVHMLPNLRQLDDRPVRESERKASQLHFTSGDSLDSRHSLPSTLKGGRPQHCRVQCADSLAKCLVLDADDEAVLNLIAECEWDLSNPPGSTSGSHREQETDFPSSQDSTDVDASATASRKSSESTQKMAHPWPVSEKYRKHRMPGAMFQVSPDQEGPGHPVGAGGPLSSEETLARPGSSESSSEGACFHPEAEELQPRGASVAREVAPEAACGSAGQLVLTQAGLHLLAGGCLMLHLELPEGRRHGQGAGGRAPLPRGPTSVLYECLCCLRPPQSGADLQLSRTGAVPVWELATVVPVILTSQDMDDDLKRRLDESLEENSSLKSLLFSMRNDGKGSDATAALSVQVAGLQTSVKSLSGEIAELKQHLSHYDRIQELTQMLQESHRCAGPSAGCGASPGAAPSVSCRVFLQQRSEMGPVGGTRGGDVPGGPVGVTCRVGFMRGTCRGDPWG